VVSSLPLEDFVFSAGGRFLFGTAAGYAIKKVMKIAVVVVGLFVAALVYLSHKGKRIDECVRTSCLHT
jgi:uncharacterized membrane protein (Fun14 family)